LILNRNVSVVAGVDSNLVGPPFSGVFAEVRTKQQRCSVGCVEAILERLNLLLPCCCRNLTQYRFLIIAIQVSVETLEGRTQ